MSTSTSFVRPICQQCLSTISRARARARTRTRMRPSQQAELRTFTIYTSHLSGHSKWATIKHDKAKVDAARSRTRTMHALDISNASKMYGADPKMNARLADAIARAKKASMPKANIEAAIARGQGLSPSGTRLESFVEEATVQQAGVAVLVDVLTDNKQQAKLEIRRVIKTCDVQQGKSAYLFDKRGELSFALRDGVDEEMVLEQAVNANALDVEASESGYIVYTELSNMTTVAEHLKTELDLEMQASEISWYAKEQVDPLEEGATLLADFIEKLKDIPSVKEVYTNAR